MFGGGEKIWREEWRGERKSRHDNGLSDQHSAGLAQDKQQHNRQRVTFHLLVDKQGEQNGVGETARQFVILGSAISNSRCLKFMRVIDSKPPSKLQQFGWS